MNKKNREKEAKNNDVNIIDEVLEKYSNKIEKISKKALKILDDESKLKKLAKKFIEEKGDMGVPKDQLNQLVMNMLKGAKNNYLVKNFTDYAKSMIKEKNDEKKIKAEIKKIIDDYSDPEKRIKENLEETVNYFLEQYRLAMNEKNKIAELEKELEKYKSLSEQYLTMSRNLKNDYQRLKDRTEKEKKEIIENANEELLMSILNIMDDLEKAIESLEKNISEEYRSHFRGIELVYQKINKLIKMNNIEEVESLGAMFDPNIHEAMMQDNDSLEEEGTITEVFKKGYKYNDRIIRSALVKVATKKSENKE